MLWLVIAQAAALAAAIAPCWPSGDIAGLTIGEYARRLLTFGWPLLVNGLLMFGIVQGDRLIIGTAYSVYDLGIYSVALTLAMAPHRCWAA